MTDKEEKYLQNKIEIIKAIIVGTITGIEMFRILQGKGYEVSVRVNREIEKLVRDIWKRAKRK